MTVEARMAMSDFEMRALTHSCRYKAINYLMPYAQEMAAKQRQELAKHHAAQFVMMTKSMRDSVEAALNLEEYPQQCMAWTEAEIAGFLGEGNAELALRLLQTQTPKELEQMATAALGDSALTSMFVAELTRLKAGPEGRGVTRS
ncbi:hypothetical protein BLNAU_16711 [Blattamonas nauphoetae]|uniref:DUF892 family protein n=1 Tax=Blattamonas nauphoetae TaxID=2049346 RepID=A0ABQ9XAL3_9EUKA|nr:hypothetical protein BLNAU_16711 [Blattamonas nauphoetae]